MVDPAYALIVFGLLVVVSAVLFWPRRGVVARVGRVLRMTERVRSEDALKHLYNCEYEGRRGTIDSLAGALEISQSQAARLVGRLVAQELIRSDGQGLPLTDAGRGYALRILRTHRLWERYLADRTNVHPAQWHEQAEHQEHRLAPAETEALAARMGHPLYDPHGDPIPTAEGELPPSHGVALTALEPGRTGTIVHLEDEPREVYERLVAANLALLMQIELLEISPELVRFTADGVERRLDPIAATNITVRPTSEAEQGTRPYRKLSELRQGETATVIQVAATCQGPQRRRLLDLGLVPGTEITAELGAAFKGPVAYRVRGAVIALRKSQADAVHVVKDAGDARQEAQRSA